MVKVLEVNVDDIGLGGVYSLVKNVIVHKSDSFKIDIASWEKFENQNNIKQLNRYNCDVYYIGYVGNKLVKQWYCFWNLKKLIQREKYQYVHIHSDVSNKMLVAAMAAKCAGVKNIILHSHASDVDGFHRKLKRRIHKFCRIFLGKIGTKFVSCSDLAAKWMFPKISLSEIIMIKNGVDLEKFRYDENIRKKTREELQVENEIVIGHVGRFAYQKNHEYLIEVFEKLHNSVPSARLLLIGEGELQKQIREKCMEKDILDVVFFYGTSHEVHRLMQAMDIFVLPSHFEGLPIVGVEAQAAGLPVIFSNEITKEAALTENVTFLPIDKNSIDLWVESIKKYVRVKRHDEYERISACGFCLENTLNDFLKLYR